MVRNGATFELRPWWQMIDPIRISVPTTVEITIKQAQLFPYREVRPLRDNFSDTSNGITRPWGLRTHQYLSWWNNLLELEDAKEIDIPYGDWRGMLYNNKVKTELLADPQNKVGLFFIGSKNFRQIMDQKSGTEMFVIDDVFYRRITWRSLSSSAGRTNDITFAKWANTEPGHPPGASAVAPSSMSEAGVVWRTEHGLTFFLCPCKKLNQREYKTAILDGIGIEVMKRDEPNDRN